MFINLPDPIHQKLLAPSSFDNQNYLQTLLWSKKSSPVENHSHNETLSSERLKTLPDLTACQGKFTPCFQVAFDF
jgi:hypothetical protein